jgi:hypothetical protein
MKLLDNYTTTFLVIIDLKIKVLTAVLLYHALTLKKSL